MPHAQKHEIVRRLAAVATVLLALTVSACDDDDDPAGPASAADTYLIASIEQQGFPECVLGSTGCTLNDTGTEVVVLESGVLDLAANGTFTLVVSGTIDGVDEELGTAGGTWTRTQTGVTLNATGVPIPLTGTFSSAAEDELVFVLPGSVFGAGTGTVTVTFDRQ